MVQFYTLIYYLQFMMGYSKKSKITNIKLKEQDLKSNLAL